MTGALILAAAVAWTGLEPENQLGGRKVSAGYLQGKVVMVDRWGATCPPCRTMLPRLEHVWRNYKTKPFVLLGGHCPGMGSAEQVKAAVAEHSLTYPVYEGAGLASGEPGFSKIPFIYVVDATGRVVYAGHDERRAEEAAVRAMTNLAAPPDEEYWRRLVDFELDVLPGRAFLHIREFSKKFPAAAKAYSGAAAELKKRVGVEKLAQLEEFSRTAKDFDPNGKDMALKTLLGKIQAVAKAYEPYKALEDAVLAQEARNCLADLAWAEAGVKAVLEARKAGKDKPNTRTGTYRKK